MTYKNTKFEDSAVMRSLEKLALKKGLVKADELKKEASVDNTKAKYEVTSDLSQNILKLCSGLRKQGFETYANELESKFLALKCAENILEEAHPEGSVKLKDMEGDSIVEDCEEQKKKIEEIIKKTPKGKFGQDIVNLVKITLAQGATPLEIIGNLLQKGRVLWEGIDSEVRKNTSKWALHWSEDYSWGTISMRISKRFSYQPERMTVDAIEKQFTDIKEALEFINKMDKKDLEARLSGSFNELFKLYGPMRKARDEFNQTDSAQRAGKVVAPSAKPEGNTIKEVTVESSPESRFVSRLDKHIKDLQGWAVQLELKKYSPQEMSTAQKWIGDQIKDFQKIKLLFERLTEPEQKSSFISSADSRVQELANENVQFYQEWIQ